MSDLKIYAQNLESAAMEQIETLASAPAFDGARIRIMPDVECPHCGARLEADYEDREGWIGGDEYENEAECPVREREFKLMRSMSIDYEAKTMESEDDGVLLG